MNDMQTIIKSIDKLKPIPQVANKIMSLMEDPESSMSDLSEVILYDQALTANLLKACNSPYFGFSKRIDSIHQAIVLLGMSFIADLVFLTGGVENLHREQKGYDLREGELWRYSVLSALIARELSENKGMKNTHLIFTAALLKDIGKVVLSQYVADSFNHIYSLVSEHGFSFREAEKEVIGIDHAELGGMVFEKWNFSPQMVTIVRNHHLSEELRGNLETAIVYLADTLCMMMGVGVGSDGLAYRFHRKVLTDLSFSEKDMQDIMAGFGAKLQQLEEIINIS
ncbi:MAG: HDOD domain-containing protein [Thermodesulfobacteriota bacterium]|nr:HDOD domain-containing protein [Thermodesulfobacteriota bacterium]